MAKKEEVPVEAVVEEAEVKQNVLLETAHKALLLGFGAVGLGQDLLMDGQEELYKLFDRLVERGEVMEKDSRTWLNEVVRRNKPAEEEIVVETS